MHLAAAKTACPPGIKVHHLLAVRSDLAEAAYDCSNRDCGRRPPLPDVELLPDNDAPERRHALVLCDVRLALRRGVAC